MMYAYIPQKPDARVHEVGPTGGTYCGVGRTVRNWKEDYELIQVAEIPVTLRSCRMCARIKRTMEQRASYAPWPRKAEDRQGESK